MTNHASRREPHKRFRSPSWWVDADFVYRHRRKLEPENHNVFLRRMKSEMEPTTQDLAILKGLVRRVLDGSSFDGDVKKLRGRGGSLF